MSISRQTKWHWVSWGSPRQPLCAVCHWCTAAAGSQHTRADLVHYPGNSQSQTQQKHNAKPHLRIRSIGILLFEYVTISKMCMIASEMAMNAITGTKSHNLLQIIMQQSFNTKLKQNSMLYMDITTDKHVLILWHFFQDSLSWTVLIKIVILPRSRLILQQCAANANVTFWFLLL